MDNNISTVIAQDKTQMTEHVLLAGHVVTMEPAIYVTGKKYQFFCWGQQILYKIIMIKTTCKKNETPWPDVHRKKNPQQFHFLHLPLLYC